MRIYGEVKPDFTGHFKTKLDIFSGPTQLSQDVLYRD